MSMTREEAIEELEQLLRLGMTLKMASDVFGVTTTKPLRLPSPPCAAPRGRWWRKCLMDGIKERE